jgi:hypothetical protein
MGSPFNLPSRNTCNSVLYTISDPEILSFVASFYDSVTFTKSNTLISMSLKKKEKRKPNISYDNK